MLNEAVVAPGWSAWSAWANLTQVRILSGSTHLAETRLPITIPPDGDGRYADLRVVDDRGVETPFAIDPPGLATNVRDVALASGGFVAGQGSQTVLDLGRRPSPINSVELGIDVDQFPSYFKRVAVDASGDRRRWRTLRASAIVYRVADDDGKGAQRVTFPLTRSRWLRVRVLDPHGPFPLSGASVARASGGDDPLIRLPLDPVVTVDAASHRQVWTFAAARPFRPAAVYFENDSAAFADASAAFVRPVRIEAGTDGAWTFAGDGTIGSYADGARETAFGFPEDTAAAWRVVVENGDDAPLTGVRPVLLAVPHELVFEAEPGHTYAMLSGNPNARAASYDLGTRLSLVAWHASHATAEATEQNPVYVDPGPPWRRYAWSLASVFAFALALGFAKYVVRHEAKGART